MDNIHHFMQSQGKMRSPLAVPPIAKTHLLDISKDPITELDGNVEKQRQALLDFKRTLQPFEKIKQAELHSDIKPFAHQIRVANKFLNSSKDGNHNIIAAQGVGSGKTLTSLYTAETGKKSGIVKKSLVVVPASLRNNFLENGVHKFTSSSGTIYGNKEEVRRGSHSDIDKAPSVDYHIVSAEMFRKDPEKWIRNTKADTVIYDELHKAKDEAGLTFDAIKRIRPLHKNFIGLTGSFISNNPSDIVPLIDAMTYGNHKLGDRRSFEQRFLYEDASGKKHIKNVETLLPLIKPHIDYFGTDQMSKSDIPEKQVQEIYVEMSPDQHKLFNYAIGTLDPKVINKLHEDITSLSEKEVSHIFSKIIHARKVSNAIHTLDDRVTLEQSAERTPKVKRMLDDVQQHMKEHPDAQVVLYSNLIHGGVDVLRAGLKSRGIPHGFFIGKKQGVTEESRQKDIEDFKAGKTKAIVISSAGAEGLNLPNTTLFASLDSHFNPERVLQAEARGVRAGGLAHRPVDKRKVLVRRYISISPRGFQNPVSGLWDTFRSWFWNTKKPQKNTLNVPSVDDWVLNIAKKKHMLNQQLRDQLSKTGSFKVGTTLREDYYHHFGDRLNRVKDPHKARVTKEEKTYLEKVRNTIRAKALSPYVGELLQEALRLAPGDPKVLAILALIWQRQKDQLSINPLQSEDIASLSDRKLTDLLRGLKTPKENSSEKDLHNVVSSPEISEDFGS